jgi:hypothetical protein
MRGDAVLLVVARRFSELSLSLSQLHVLFWLLVASGCWVALSRARAPRTAWLSVVICSVAWLRWDKVREGRILVSFGATHGLTEADLIVPLVVCAAAATSGLRQALTGRVRPDDSRTPR